MAELLETKSDIRNNVLIKFNALSEQEVSKLTKEVEKCLFDFANFLEANIVLLYIDQKGEVPTKGIIEKCYDYNKIVLLPAFDTKKLKMTVMKVDNPKKDLKMGPRGILEPDPDHCKIVPIDRADIALIPGIAFDEKNGRLGYGDGYYDKLIPKLLLTTRKIAITFEDHVFPQVPMESGNKYVDIIITNKRVIYKI